VSRPRTCISVSVVCDKTLWRILGKLIGYMRVSTLPHSTEVSSELERLVHRSTEPGPEPHVAWRQTGDHHRPLCQQPIGKGSRTREGRSSSVVVKAASRMAASPKNSASDQHFCTVPLEGLDLPSQPCIHAEMLKIPGKSTVIVESDRVRSGSFAHGCGQTVGKPISLIHKNMD